MQLLRDRRHGRVYGVARGGVRPMRTRGRRRIRMQRAKHQLALHQAASAGLCPRVATFVVPTAAGATHPATRCTYSTQQAHVHECTCIHDHTAQARSRQRASPHSAHGRVARQLTQALATMRITGLRNWCLVLRARTMIMSSTVSLPTLRASCSNDGSNTSGCPSRHARMRAPTRSSRQLPMPALLGVAPAVVCLVLASTSHGDTGATARLDAACVLPAVLPARWRATLPSTRTSRNCRLVGAARGDRCAPGRSATTPVVPITHEAAGGCVLRAMQ